MLCCVSSNDFRCSVCQLLIFQYLLLVKRNQRKHLVAAHKTIHSETTEIVNKNAVDPTGEDADTTNQSTDTAGDDTTDTVGT